MMKENPVNLLRSLVLVCLALSAIGLASPQASARDVLIGSTSYEARPIRDTINIGGREGQFRGLRFDVRQSDVEVLEFRVVYGNGSSEDFRVRQFFRAGTSSRVFDLAGRQRAIRQIIVTYVPSGPARIQFYGVEGGGGGVTANWEQLGCKSVGFLIDRDVIQVGRQDGRFRALRLEVSESPVEFFDLRVVFGNGVKQDIRVRELIRPGERTRPLDLFGENRGIARVEMVYRSIPGFKGKARVCVSGLSR